MAKYKVGDSIYDIKTKTIRTIIEVHYEIYLYKLNNKTIFSNTIRHIDDRFDNNGKLVNTTIAKILYLK